MPWMANSDEHKKYRRSAGPAFAEWRARHGLTRETVAGCAGVTAKTVDNWEMGHTSPKAENIVGMLRLGKPGLLTALEMRG